MKVILRQDVESLGKAGDVVKVADGYGRNFLIPQKLALEATEKNLKIFENEKKVILKQSERLQREAQELAARLNGVVCTIARRIGEQDKIFGSVGVRDIEEALAAQGITVERKNILLADPLKALGEYPVTIKTGAGLSAEIKVVVVAES